MTLNEFRTTQRDTILRIASQHGACNVRVFGSVARGDATETSDLDLLVELEPGRTLFDLGGLLMDVRSELGVRVDVHRADAPARAPRARSGGSGTAARDAERAKTAESVEELLGVEDNAAPSRAARTPRDSPSIGRVGTGGPRWILSTPFCPSGTRSWRGPNGGMSCGGLRPHDWFLPSTPVGAAGPRVGSDGAVSTAHRGLSRSECNQY